MTPRAFVQHGEHEMVKAVFHVALGSVALPCAVYNVVAWCYRRDRHLALNGAIYAALVGLEVKKVWHHVKDGR